MPPGGAEAWPAKLGLYALLGGWLAANVAIFFLAGVFEVAGGSIKSPAFIVTASIVQGVLFVAAAIFVARTRGPASARDFGLLRAPFRSTAGKTAAVFFGYLIVFGLYAQLVKLTADETPEKLGADEGTIGMVAFVLMAAIVAPFAEEFFFRGMVFRAFANGMGVVPAALVTGLLFGALHIDSGSAERLLQVVPLAGLGVLMALLYAWSGTLFAPIAVHATNNALAVGYYAVQNDSSLGVALAPVAWALMIGFCIFGHRFTDRAPDRQAGVAGAVVD